jgi:hypothetical protein
MIVNWKERVFVPSMFSKLKVVILQLIGQERDGKKINSDMMKSAISSFGK